MSIIDNTLFFARQGEAPPNTAFFPARNLFTLPAVPPENSIRPTQRLAPGLQR